MPRLSRIIQAGFYHVINRGVERRVVFYKEVDFDTFLNILNLTSIKYNIILHAFCLMNNHYGKVDFFHLYYLTIKNIFGLLQDI